MADALQQTGRRSAEHMLVIALVNLCMARQALTHTYAERNKSGAGSLL